MNQNQIKGAQERIRYHTHEMLALFTVLVLLAGWIGGRIAAGEYDILFAVAFAGDLFIFGFIYRSRWMVLNKYIPQMEASHNG